MHGTPTDLKWQTGTEAGAETAVGTKAGAETAVGTEAGAETAVGTEAGAETAVGTEAGAETGGTEIEGMDREKESGTEMEGEWTLFWYYQLPPVLHPIRHH